MIEIRENRSRFVLSPYVKGMSPTLEKRLSIFDPNQKKYTDVLYELDERRKILYIPRGFGAFALQSVLETDLVEIKDFVEDIDNIHMPRQVRIKLKNGVDYKEEYADIQEDAVKFLVHTPDSQRILTLDVGFGKTFCTIFAAAKMNVATLIICKGLTDQWIREIEKYTVHKEGKGIYKILGEDTIVKLLKEKDPKDVFYVCSADTFRSALDRGESLQELVEHLGIGLKVFDEFHRNFVSNNRIDLRMQVRDTIYLTATVGRSDEIQDRVFKRVYAKVPIHGTHTHMIKQYYHVQLVNYDTKPRTYDIARCTLRQGFNPKIYFKYLLGDQHRLMYFYSILKYYTKRMLDADPDAKVLIIVDSLSMIKVLKEMLQKSLKIPIGTYCGLVPDVEARKKELLKKVIFATLNLGSTGLDIPNLRLVISATTFRSPITTRQTLGRLRFIEGKAVYIADLCDFGFPSMRQQRLSRLREIKPRAHEIVEKTFEFEDVPTLLGDHK